MRFSKQAFFALFFVMVGSSDCFGAKEGVRPSPIEVLLEQQREACNELVAQLADTQTVVRFVEKHRPLLDSLQEVNRALEFNFPITISGAYDPIGVSKVRAVVQNILEEIPGLLALRLTNVDGYTFYAYGVDGRLGTFNYLEGRVYPESGTVQPVSGLRATPLHSVDDFREHFSGFNEPL